MARMGHELENPAVIGEYYRLADRLPDTDENRLEYIRQKGLGWRAAAMGLRVEPQAQECQKLILTDIWDEHPEYHDDWAAELVDAYWDSYTDWRCEPCMEPLSRRVTA